MQISLLSENAIQLLWRHVFTESLLRALPFCTMYGAGYRPDTHLSRWRQSHNVQGILYSSSQHFLVVLFNISFSSHRSRELSTARATPTLPLRLPQCPRLKIVRRRGISTFATKRDLPVSSQPGCFPLPITTSSNQAFHFHEFQAHFTCLPSLHHSTWLSSVCVEVRT